MANEEFKFIEKKLYDYYETEKILSSLKFKIGMIEEQIEEIEERIAGTKINIDDDGLQAINYYERVQSTSTGESYAEKAVINQIDSLEKECLAKREIKSSLEKKVRNIKLDKSVLEYNIKLLSEKDKKVIEDKYKKHIPDWKIAEDLHVGSSTAYRIRARVINEMKNWMCWL